ncbi:hypothetical protein KABACHOK_01380 [Brevundimonas phage vB_BpoS-Kabachok]|uniref:Uncharacterized protein n=1 Tax=Brevundimonas phage vB_BpoS-Kabachok TaxID=2948600 RepID=A0A9E7SJZ3_9CAUD|nr:hypothetical protein KABACHOK_01380 [Brevundimonas phage vB_BpoS-Kabachok]
MADEVESVRTWGFRVVEYRTEDGPEYGLHEVQYIDGLPVSVGQILLWSETRDFVDVFRKLEDAVARPLHDPKNPQPAERMSARDKALGYPDGIQTQLGYLPGRAENKVPPLTLAEIVTHHRQWAVDLERALQEDRVPADLRDKAQSDLIMSMRIARTLEPLEKHAAMAAEAATLIQGARDDLFQVEDALHLQDGERALFDTIHTDLENAGGLASSLSVAPGPDNCEACHGVSGGAPGNENIVDGKRLCDDCSVDVMVEQATRS